MPIYAGKFPTNAFNSGIRAPSYKLFCIIHKKELNKPMSKYMLSGL